MKRLIVVLTVASLAVGNLFAQNNTPEVNSIVNKQFDENGNLIQYDSTYVQQWSSDSTFNFTFDNNFSFKNGFPDMNEIFKDFFGDSAGTNFGFPDNFTFSPFDDDDFVNGFSTHFPDSVWMKNFGFNPDSLFENHFDFQRQFNSPEQRTEWEKLMEKQQKEQAEFMKKWERK